MKILHYTLGFSPVRTGGLTKYATDLMEEQIKLGNKVYALFPALQFIFSNKVHIKRIGENNSIIKYKLINSLPIALFNGIKTPKDFMHSCDINIYINFLIKIRPDIIHIHSLMGIHKEFFLAANQLNIKVVFTSHDYYGLAPVPTFFAQGKSFDSDNTNLAWNLMSRNALTTKKLRLFQNPFYTYIRSHLSVVKKFIKRKHQSLNLSEFDVRKNLNLLDYSKIRKYYYDIFYYIDIFLFNSHLAKEIYINNLGENIDYAVLTISNSSIEKRNVASIDRDILHIAYIGPDEEYKGYFEYLEWARKQDRNKYKFLTYGYKKNNIADKFIEQHGIFSKTNLQEVYDNIDVIIVPSVWKETFGFVVAEALSYGKIVFASQHVGAKELLKPEFIFNNINDINLELLNYPANCSKVRNIQEHTLEVLNSYNIGKT